MNLLRESKIKKSKAEANLRVSYPDPIPFIQVRSLDQIIIKQAKMYLPTPHLENRKSGEKRV